MTICRRRAEADEPMATANLKVVAAAAKRPVIEIAGVSKTYHDYPQAYHLLMYDEKKEVIFKDIETWVGQLRKDRLKKL